MKGMTNERLWVLKWWGQGGWSIGRPTSRGIKKWEHHIDMLVKSGLLEEDVFGGPGANLCRITDAGRLALSSNTRSGE